VAFYRADAASASDTNGLMNFVGERFGRLDTNHYDPGQILVGFMLSVIAGAQRFAHTNQLRSDRALHALLGMKRFPSDDTILNY
jgi:hypothetical protein